LKFEKLISKVTPDSIVITAPLRTITFPGAVASLEITQLEVISIRPVDGTSHGGGGKHGSSMIALPVIVPELVIEPPLQLLMVPELMMLPELVMVPPKLLMIPSLLTSLLLLMVSWLMMMPGELMAPELLMVPELSMVPELMTVPPGSIVSVLPGPIMYLIAGSIVKVVPDVIILLVEPWTRAPVILQENCSVLPEGCAPV